MSELLCPLLVAGYYANSGEDIDTDTKCGGSCAWFDTKIKRCGMLSSIENIEGIHNSMVDIAKAQLKTFDYMAEMLRSIANGVTD